MRFLGLVWVMLGGAVSAQSGFADYANGLANRAVSRGIDRDVVIEAFRGLRYNPDVIFRDRNQAEFRQPLAHYVSAAVSDTQVRDGRRALRRQRRVLEQIEAEFGVEGEVVAAIWGVESRYGTRMGDIPVMDALVTLAFDGRRRSVFENQVFSALTTLERGEVAAVNMTGSWAGAMGHTQFMPTSYEAYAVDFTGDGRRDIWGRDPADALASTAAYLRRFGWQTGQPWGVEVLLPPNFELGQARRNIKRLPSEWARRGVFGVDGSAVRNFGQASVLLPAGRGGVAFLIFDNFRVLERYNASESYVIAVGHLSDRLQGAEPLAGLFPSGERALTEDERLEVQRRLLRLGFDTGGLDGRIGSKSRAAIRAYQASSGLEVTGFASLALLEALRR